MKPRDDDRLRHLYNALLEARDLLGDTSVEVAANDRKLALALVKLIEIAGEAATNVSTETRRRIAEIPWDKLVATRNRLIHGYYDIDVTIVVNTIRNDFPPVIAALEDAARRGK